MAVWKLSDSALLKVPEDENAKLKWLLADTMLDNVVLKDLLGMEAAARHRFKGKADIDRAEGTC